MLCRGKLTCGHLCAASASYLIIFMAMNWHNGGNSGLVHAMACFTIAATVPATTCTITVGERPFSAEVSVQSYDSKACEDMPCGVTLNPTIRVTSRAQFLLVCIPREEANDK